MAEGVEWDRAGPLSADERSEQLAALCAEAATLTEKIQERRRERAASLVETGADVARWRSTYRHLAVVRFEIQVLERKSPGLD